jgi:hypothetical protein
VCYVSALSLTKRMGKERRAACALLGHSLALPVLMPTTAVHSSLLTFFAFPDARLTRVGVVLLRLASRCSAWHPSSGLLLGDARLLCLVFLVEPPFSVRCDGSTCVPLLRAVTLHTLSIMRFPLARLPDGVSRLPAPRRLNPVLPEHQTTLSRLRGMCRGVPPGLRGWPLLCFSSWASSSFPAIAIHCRASRLGSCIMECCHPHPPLGWSVSLSSIQTRLRDQAISASSSPFSHRTSSIPCLRARRPSPLFSLSIPDHAAGPACHCLRRRLLPLPKTPSLG